MNPIGFPLVTTFDDEARASTEVIAAGMGQQHRAVMQLLRRHIAALERFGRVQFEVASFATRGGAQQREIARLNERQAMLLITMMRNTDRVVDFKVSLVAEFARTREALAQRNQSLWQQMQALIAREVESKVRASFGSHLMLERKRDIPLFDEQRERLESLIQPPLFLN